MTPRLFHTGLKAFFLGLLLASLLPSLSQAAALNHSHQAIKSISRAYGFVVGQSIALKVIEQAHPGLAAEARAARAAFESGFPGAEGKLEAELAAVFGDKSFAVMRAETFSLLTDVMQREHWSEEQGRNFIAGLKSRAQGEGIEQDILDYLLAVVYAAEPASEFSDGFRQRYRTDGSGNAQGLRLRLQLPRSWAGAEGERPHIVRKWTSEGGNGHAVILLEIRDAQGFAPTRAEIARFIASGGAQELAADGGEVVDAAAFTLETLPGVSAVLRVPLERAGVRMLSWAQVYRIHFRGKALSLTCMQAGAEGEAELVEQRFRRIQPLCRQVANSLVLEQLYE